MKRFCPPIWPTCAPRDWALGQPRPSKRTHAASPSSNARAWASPGMRLKAGWRAGARRTNFRRQSRESCEADRLSGGGSRILSGCAHSWLIRNPVAERAIATLTRAIQSLDAFPERGRPSGTRGSARIDRGVRPPGATSRVMHTWRKPMKSSSYVSGTSAKCAIDARFGRAHPRRCARKRRGRFAGRNNFPNLVANKRGKIDAICSRRLTRMQFAGL
jgi:hypothetical protein